MDAPNPSATPGLATRAPMHIGAVGLRARDLNRLIAFYRDAIGLDLLRTDGEGAVLGAGDTDLLHIEHAPDAVRDEARAAGLYHTAFLMPTRADLGRWLRHAGELGVQLTGASDHAVSEALYLDDPEGNGIEVYCDRSPESWRWSDHHVEMTTKPLDLDDLSRAAPASDRTDAAPEGLRIGHVHLRVGDLARAEKFWSSGIGLDVTRRRDGALFMSSGGYHHHIACNIWHSDGAGARDPDRAGLAWIALDATDGPGLAALNARLRSAGYPTRSTSEGMVSADPWGTTVRIRNQNR